MNLSRFCITALLPLILSVIPSFSATISKKRVKRDMFQFCDIIQCATKATCLNYLDHGCWCGLGNRGTSVMDSVDECCRTHDSCYDTVKDIFCMYYIIRYNWSCQDSFLHGPSSEPVCDQNQASVCAARICACDTEFAACIREQHLNKDVRCTLRS